MAKISDLILELEQWLDEQGDLEVTTLDGEGIATDVALVNGKTILHVY